MPPKDKPNPGTITHWQQKVAEITGMSLGRVKQLIKDGMTVEDIINGLRTEYRNAGKGAKK